MYLGTFPVNQSIERVMITSLRISSCIASLLLATMFVTTCATAQIVYDWQNSKEGWVPASESNLGCNLDEQPEAMAMRAFNTTPVMRSGTVNESLGIDAGTYDRVQITLRNPTTSGNPNARLFAYAPETNAFMCHWNVPVDTEMEGFQTYTLDLTSPPTVGVARLKGQWGALVGAVHGELPMETPSTGNKWWFTILWVAPMRRRATTRLMQKWTTACVSWWGIRATTETTTQSTT